MGPLRVIVPAVPLPAPKTASLPFTQVRFWSVCVWLNQLASPAVQVPVPSWAPSVTMLVSQTKTSAWAPTASTRVANNDTMIVATPRRQRSWVECMCVLFGWKLGGLRCHKNRIVQMEGGLLSFQVMPPATSHPVLRLASRFYPLHSTSKNCFHQAAANKVLAQKPFSNFLRLPLPSFEQQPTEGGQQRIGHRHGDKSPHRTEAQRFRQTPGNGDLPEP